jgi:hypothetical protein
MKNKATFLNFLWNIEIVCEDLWRGGCQPYFYITDQNMDIYANFWQIFF